MTERIENALNTVESEVARAYGLESPVTRRVFEATEVIRAEISQEKTSWTLDELAALSDEERMTVLEGMSEEEKDTLCEQMFEENPLAAFLGLLAVSMGDLQ